MRGEAGKPRPVLSFNGSQTPLVLERGASVSHLEIQIGTSQHGVNLNEGVLEDVIVTNTAPSGIACFQRGGIIRDSVCLAQGSSSIALGNVTPSVGPLTRTLRNVTAIASGSNSVGLALFASAGVKSEVNAKAVIAEGTHSDVKALASGAGAEASVVLENSAFDSVEPVSENSGVAKITAPGTLANIEATPLLAADGFHELPGSPTIDKGATDASSGRADIDGGLRKSGLATDIGADESPSNTTTTTTLTCLPAALKFGDPSTCTAKVENSISGGNAPSGQVEFFSDQPGSFSEGATATRTCTLTDAGAGKASCQLTYTPAAGGIRQKITASYQGDLDHDPSEETVELTVSRRDTATTLTCASAAVALNAASTCTATVKDSSGATSSLSPGAVNFSSDQPGAFSGDGAIPEQCILTDEGNGKGSCQITYTPTAAGAHKITATYSGDALHQPSSASSQLSVSPHQSTTTLTCAPASLLLGAAGASCTAMVSDPAAGPTAPSGAVKLTSDGPGAFANGGACTLAGASAGKASCQITYTPSALMAICAGLCASSTHKITASYQGDPSHEKSQGATSIQVTAPTKAPNTTLKLKPRQKTTSRLAKFSFASDQAGSPFQCKLDNKPFRPCRSPFKARVKPGRHSFSVRALSSAGVPDPTPVRFHWKVS